ncbi:hypothetical protein A6J81_03395 [Citrobacter braakii]|uniref:hypothetical protein n=1 Tax=Citrobacter europaeus TaxID=1914243 RepID=UPI0009B72032|nr:hypothetical protein A6J81_03395 [Citrobacter braakii]
MSMRFSFITKVALVIGLILSAFWGINSYRKSLIPESMVHNSRLEVLAIPGSTLSSIIRGNGTAEEMLDLIETGKNAMSKYPHETPPSIGNIDRVVHLPVVTVDAKPRWSTRSSMLPSIVTHTVAEEMPSICGECTPTSASEEEPMIQNSRNSPGLQIGGETLGVEIPAPKASIPWHQDATAIIRSDVESAVRPTRQQTSTNIDFPSAAVTQAPTKSTNSSITRPIVSAMNEPEQDEPNYERPIKYTASIGYPATYELNNQFTVSVAVTKGDNPKVTRDKIRDVSVKGHNIVDETPLMAPAKKVQATLLYDNLRREPVETVIQPVYKDYSTLWTWRITPDKTGAHTITILVNTVLPNDQPNASITNEYEVIITESMWSKVSRFLGPLIPEVLKSEIVSKLVYAPLLAFIVWLVRRIWRSIRRKRKQAVARREETS